MSGSTGNGCRQLLLLALAAAAQAADLTWTTTGEVVIDRAEAQAIAAPGQGAVVTWMAPAGTTVAAGDPLARFDTGSIRGKLADRRAALAIAQGELTVSLLKIEQEQATTRDDEAQARIDARLTEAVLARRTAGDPAAVQQGVLRVRMAELRRTVAADELAAARADLVAGVGSGTAVRHAELALIDARAQVEQCVNDQLSLGVKAPEHVLTRLTIERDQAKAKAAAASAGASASGDSRPRTPRPRGEAPPSDAAPAPPGARPAAAPAESGSRSGRRRGSGDSLALQLRRERLARQAEVDRLALELHECERDSDDHTALAQLEVTALRDGSGDAPLRFVFAAPAQTPPDGWTLADQAGWDAPPLRFTSGPKGPAALVAGQRIWRLPLAAGRYRIAVTLGDGSEWRGPRLAVEGRSWVVPGAITDPTTFAQEVDLTDGVLDVMLGSSGVGRTITAPAAGVLLPADGVRLGFKAANAIDPCLLLADPASARLRVLATPALAGALRGAATAAGQVDVQSIAWRGADGSTGSASVDRIGNAAVPPWRGPGLRNDEVLDRTAREVWLRPADPLALRSDTTVAVEFTFAPPAATSVVPPHLAQARDGAWSVADRAGERRVAAVRLGDRVVVAGSLDRPRPPVLPPAAARSDRFPGEVVPARLAKVALPWIEGRVESLIADGTPVAAGAEILVVANAEIEQGRARRERERSQAAQNLALANERQAERARRLADEHAGRLAALTLAELGLTEKRWQDPAERGRTAITLAQAESRAALSASRLAAAIAAGANAPAGELAAANDAAHEDQIAVVRARLEDAATHHGASLGGIVAALTAATVARIPVERREADLLVARADARAQAANDRYRYESASGRNGWEASFELMRRIKAPIAGTVRWLMLQDEGGGEWHRIDRGTQVWSGMSVAEIADRSEVAFIAEAPESTYGSLAIGALAGVEFPQLDGLRLPGRVVEVGRAFQRPREALGDDPGRPVDDRRVVPVRIAFDDPAGAAKRLGETTRGWLVP